MWEHLQATIAQPSKYHDIAGTCPHCPTKYGWSWDYLPTIHCFPTSGCIPLSKWMIPRVTNGISTVLHMYISNLWKFPNIGEPPVIIQFHRIFLYKPTILIILGYPPFMETTFPKIFPFVLWFSTKAKPMDQRRAPFQTLRGPPRWVSVWQRSGSKLLMPLRAVGCLNWSYTSSLNWCLMMFNDV